MRLPPSILFLRLRYVFDVDKCPCSTQFSGRKTRCFQSRMCVGMFAKLVKGENLGLMIWLSKFHFIVVHRVFRGQTDRESSLKIQSPFRLNKFVGTQHHFVAWCLFCRGFLFTRHRRPERKPQRLNQNFRTSHSNILPCGLQKLNCASTAKIWYGISQQLPVAGLLVDHAQTSPSCRTPDSEMLRGKLWCVAWHHSAQNKWRLLCRSVLLSSLFLRGSGSASTSSALPISDT